MCQPYIESATTFSDIIINMNKSQETMVFSGRQKLTSAMKLGQKSDARLQTWCSIQVKSS